MPFIANPEYINQLDISASAASSAAVAGGALFAFEVRVHTSVQHLYTF
jgi:hypothetical protein